MVQVISSRKNVMGTMSITFKMKGLRKPQEFIVYPIESGDDVEKLYLQSDARWVELSVADGTLEMGTARNYPNSAYFAHDKAMGKTIKDKLTEEQLKAILNDVASTSGYMVGNLIKCDNSGARQLNKG